MLEFSNLSVIHSWIIYFYNNLLENVKAHSATIEWQKRGLSHAHILLIVDGPKPQTAEDIDKIVSAEFPEKEKKIHNSTKSVLGV